jgi:hypothetical protein
LTLRVCVSAGAAAALSFLGLPNRLPMGGGRGRGEEGRREKVRERTC